MIASYVHGCFLWDSCVLTVFVSHSFATWPSPREISSASCWVRIPTLSSAFEYAIDPRTSARYMRWSYLRHCCAMAKGEGGETGRGRRRAG